MLTNLCHSAGAQTADELDAANSRDPLWPHSSSDSKSYDSPVSSRAEGRQAPDGSPDANGATGETVSPEAQQERKQPYKASMLTPSGIIAQIR